MIDFLALAKRLEEKGCGKCAKDIFVDTLPSESSTGIVLRSSISGDTIDYELPGFMKATFRLIARAANHGIGQEMLQKATDALHRAVGGCWQYERSHLQTDHHSNDFPCVKR